MSKAVSKLLLVSILLIACVVPYLPSVKAQSYTYTFNGPYNEDTGDFDTYLNSTYNGMWVIVHYNDGTSQDTFNVINGSYPYSAPSQPQYFSYYLYDTNGTLFGNREYWLNAVETSGNYSIYFSRTPLSTVTLNIRALGGVTVPDFCVVERAVSGVNTVVEKRLIDSQNAVQVAVEASTIYNVIVTDGEAAGFNYTFGNVNMYTTPITLTLSALSFPNDVLLQYKYLRIWAARPSSTEITVSYEDTNLQTIAVSYQLAFSNGSIAYSTTHSGENSFVDTWAGADSNITYYLSANVTQATFGASTFAQVLLRDGASTSPVDLSFLGDWPVDATQIFWVFVVFIVFGVGSVLNAYIGGFAGVATAAILVWLGWLVIPSGAIVAAFCVIFMVGIVYWKRRG